MQAAGCDLFQSRARHRGRSLLQGGKSMVEHASFFDTKETPPFTTYARTDYARLL